MFILISLLVLCSLLSAFLGPVYFLTSFEQFLCFVFFNYEIKVFKICNIFNIFNIVYNFLRKFYVFKLVIVKRECSILLANISDFHTHTTATTADSVDSTDLQHQIPPLTRNYCLKGYNSKGG